MATKNLAAFRALIRQKLRDEFVVGKDQEWANDELDILIGDCVAEISERSPHMVTEVLTTIANSKVLDISSIEDLVEIEKAEYPIGYEPRKFRNVEYLDNETIEIETTLTPSAGGSGTLTGTVTFTTGSATVTGSGTSFSDDLAANYLIRKSGSTRWYRIYSIASDTELTLAEPVRSSDNGADTVDLTEYCYEAVCLYCRKLHQLTESVSTLESKLERILVLGVTGKAAISRSRSLINKVTLGGGTTSAEMRTWGMTQLSLYRESLRGAKPRTYTEYPEG